MKRLALIATLLTTLVLVGCGPKYPKCNDDDDCSGSKDGKVENKLYCVNGLCQQCREDDDCGDETLECNAGVCDEIPGYCTDVNDCPGNQKCRDNRCGAECTDNSECDGGKCDGGNCVAANECSGDADCPSGQVCENGLCRAPTSASCDLDNVLFDYDSSTVDGSGRSALQATADCIKKDGLSVRVEGHCDERGSNEYNIALGERRARAVYKYLRSLGVSKSKLDTISYGEENPMQACGESGPSSCHRSNRRVEIKVR